MDDKTEVLIREIAEKLGTTSEYLWGILVKQAPITGVTELIVMSAWIFLLMWVFSFLKVKTTKNLKDESGWHVAEWDEVTASIALALWWGAAAMTALAIGVSLSDTLAAIFNPEYWAIKQILKII